MSETSDLPPDSATSGDEAPPFAPIRIMGQYIKDLSFEVPGAPEIYSLLQNQPPEIPISIDVVARPISETTFEVALTCHLEATVGDRKAFICELVYCAAVEVNKAVIAEEHIHPLLMIEIPRQMFPFARQIISDATGHGGFPPLQLQLVDFALLYRNKFGMPGQPQPQQPAVH